MHLALFLANVQDLWSGCRGLPCCYICRCLLCWFLQITALVAIQYLQLPALLIFADHCFGCNTVFAVALSADFCESLLWLRYNICSLLALLIFVDHSFVSFFFPIQPPVFPTPYGSWAKVAIGLSTIPLKTMGPFGCRKFTTVGRKPQLRQRQKQPKASVN